jgi:hypothetical protein
MGNSNQNGVFTMALGHHYPPYINGLDNIQP